MKKTTKSYLLIIFLIIIAGIGACNWYVTGNPFKFFLLTSYLENKSENIEYATLEFSNNEVYLNIRVNKPTTCKSIISTLGINKIIVGKKLYAPSCMIVNKHLIRIVYIKVDDV